MNIENLLNPRTLAWTGGALLVAGIAFLVSIGIRDGWITPTMQVGAATLICVALGVAGFWLKERRSQGAAAMSMVATGIAGMFATITVASQVYDFLDPLGLALLAAGAVGLIGTAVALRWNSEPLAGLALLGALASPILVGVAGDEQTVYFLLIAYCATAAVCGLRSWPVLAAGAVAVATPTAIASLESSSASTLMAVALAFWAVTVLGNFFPGFRSAEQLPPETEWLPYVTLAAVSSLIAGGVAIQLADHSTQGAAAPEAYGWMIGFSVLHLAGALATRMAAVKPRRLEEFLWALGSSGLTIGLAMAFSDSALTVAWATKAIAMAVLLRNSDRVELKLATGLLVALCAAHVLLVDAPPDDLTLSAWDYTSGALVSTVVSVLAVIAAASAWAIFSKDEIRVLAGFTALASFVYLLGILFNGLALVDTLCATAIVTVLVTRGSGGVPGLAASGAVLAIAIVQTLGYQAPLDVALTTGVVDLEAAVAALLAIAFTATCAALLYEQREVRLASAGLACLTLLYLGSVLIVATFQPSASELNALGTETSFGIRQQGQAWLSGFWALAALGGVVYGVRRRNAAVRYAALSLLSVAVVKILLFDLTSLDATYRTISFVAVGAMLLLAAFAYQNIRAQVKSGEDVPPAGAN